METRKTPLVLTASALAMALVLVGCGGGGSSGSPSGNDAVVQARADDNAGDKMDEMEKPEPKQITLPTSMYLMGDDEPMALADTTAPISLATGGMHPAGAYDLTCTAGPCEITIENGEVMATGMVTAAFNMKYADMIEANKKTMSAEMDGRALGQHEALTRSDGGYDVFTEGPGSTPLMVTPIQIPEAYPNPNNTPIPSTDIVITRGLTGDLMVMRDRDGWHGDAMAAAALGGTGWGGQKLAHSGGEQSMTVYSNIKSAKLQDFKSDGAGSVYGPGKGAGTIPHLPDAFTNSAAILTLPAAAMADAYEQGLLDEDYFPEAPTPGSATKTYDYEDDEATADYGHTFSGYFHGASGRYACATTGCTLSINPASTGAPATPTFGEQWTFTPDDTARNDSNDAQIVKQDNNWLSFGWWIKEPKAPKRNNVYQYDAQVFYGGANPYAHGRLADLAAGSAKYTGRAAGLYAVVPHMDKDKNEVPGARGEFMADAELTANFSNATLSGKIDAFEAMGSEVDMSEWSLTLVGTDIMAQSVHGHAANGMGVDSGVVQSAATGKASAGTWQATLYGPDGGSSAVAPRPTGAAGRFAANIDGNTAVAGGFGATR